MRRTTFALLLLPTALFAQTATAPDATRLPVTHVSLYKNGVGFFEHTGHITGNARVAIDFTDAQLDDVLQTLTAVDLNGGRISGAGYNSTTPIEQQLKTLGLGLGQNTDYATLLTALHGARVTVNGSGAPFTGRIVDLESRTTSAGSGNDATTGTDLLTVASETGEIRRFEVKPTLSVRLLDSSTHADLNQYLQLLDSTRSHGLRHLTLEDRGTGARTLQLSYLSEVPIWKSTYRILFTDKNSSSSANNSPGGPSSNSPDGPSSRSPGGPFTPSSLGVSGEPQNPQATQTATLQGWSVVDNTTGTDWINVKLSLIAGAPQSFLQPLSQPIYSRRPEIPVAREAQLTPQTFDSGLITADDIKKLSAEGRDVSELIKNLPGSAIRTDGANLTAPTAGKLRGVMGGMAGGSAGGVASSYNMSGSAINLPAMNNLRANPIEGGNSPLFSYEDAQAATINIQSKTTAFDDFFSYNLTEPVTIRKNESALVPILSAKVPAERVTVVHYDGNRLSQPLRALWLTNTSNLTLDRGSFSIVEDGNFGGEGLLDPIHAGEKRLLSYAADQAVHVTTEGDKSNTRLTFLRGSKGVLNIHNAVFHEITYVIHNAAADTRTIVLEEPVVQGFVLDSETAGSTDPKPVETTATAYRFRITIPAGQTVRLHSGARRNGYTTYYLTRSDDNQFQLILNQSEQNPALIAALQPILDARRKVADAQTAVDQTTKRLTDLHADEDRQRANITALANADKGSRDRFVRDLNATEDAITAAQKELATRTAALDTAKADLSTKIEAFQIDTKANAAPGTKTDEP